MSDTFELLVEEKHLDKALENKKRLKDKFQNACGCVMAEAYEDSGYGGFQAAYRREIKVSDGWLDSVGREMELITARWDAGRYEDIRQMLPCRVVLKEGY